MTIPAIVNLPMRQEFGIGDGRTLSVVNDIARKLPAIIAMRNGCSAVSGIAFGPNLCNRRRASSLVRPVGRSSFVDTGDPASGVLASDGGAIVTMV
jgi:hypothetical protein